MRGRFLEVADGPHEPGLHISSERHAERRIKPARRADQCDARGLLKVFDFAERWQTRMEIAGKGANAPLKFEKELFFGRGGVRELAGIWQGAGSCKSGSDVLPAPAGRTASAPENVFPDGGSCQQNHRCDGDDRAGCTRNLTLSGREHVARYARLPCGDYRKSGMAVSESKPDSAANVAASRAGARARVGRKNGVFLFGCPGSGGALF